MYNIEKAVAQVSVTAFNNGTPAPQKPSVWKCLFSPCGCKADFLVVTYADIQGIKRFKLPFFAPKLAHKWAQTVGAKAE